MRTNSASFFRNQLNRFTQGFPKLLGIAVLLALLLTPAASALAVEPDPTTGSIKVKKFHDLNRDGVYQGGEPILAGWTFELYMDVNGTWVFQTSGVTPAGYLYFNNLQPGAYKVVEIPQIEWINSTPLEQTTNLIAGQLVPLYFGNYLRDVDFGDLPNNYNMTTRAQNGARHQPGAIFLGATVDIDADGMPTANASGDNLVGPDEDGIVVVAPSPPYWTQGTGTIQVTVTGGVGCLYGWMDAWDSTAGAPGTDGDFTDSGTDSGGPWSEAILVNVPVNPGTQLVSFALPMDAAKYPLWARFRLAPSFQGDCSYYDANPVTTHGFIEGGEVEDYYFSFNPTAVSLQSFTAQPDGVNRSLVGSFLVLIISAGLLAFSRRLIRQQQPSA